MKNLLYIFFSLIFTTNIFATTPNLTPQQLQMIKEAGYGDYLKKLKRDASKSVDEVEKNQEIENNIDTQMQDRDSINNFSYRRDDLQKMQDDKKNYLKGAIDISKELDRKKYSKNEKILNKREFDDEIDKKKELKRYGSSFFQNKNSLNPYSVPTPDNYVLTKGDKLSITIFGIDNGNFESRIERDGTLTLDRVGKVNLAGLTYEMAKKELENKIREAFPTATDIAITISDFTPIQVVLSGLVKAPGLYNLTSFSTIKDALIQAGGILPNGSYRNIELKRGGKVVKVFDLYRLIRYGDDSSDVMLQNGDILVVKPVKKSVKLYGAVNMPAIYELKDNENFITLVSLASGLKPNADQHNVRLKRYKRNREIDVSSIALSQLYKINPKNGDEVTIFEISPQMAKSVVFEGNVVIDGEMALPRDHRLSSLFKKALHKFGKRGFFKFNTDYSFGLVVYSDHIKSFNLSKVLKGKEDLKLYGGEIIHIFKREDLKSKEYIYARGEIVDPKKRKYNFVNGMSIRDLFYVVEFKRVKDMDNFDKNQNKEYLKVVETPYDMEKDRVISPSPKVQIVRVENGKKRSYTVDMRTNPNFLLKPFDEVTFYDIEKVANQNKIFINGEVFMPGSYDIDGKYTTINQAIKLAGGLTKKAQKSECEIARYKVVGDSRVREVFKIDLQDALKRHYKIYPDDEIKIFPIANWRDKKYIVLKGEVKYPGKYAINTGEKLASVIKRAGGFTENAFVEGAVFTRDSVKKLQEEQIKDSLMKLKNRALALQSKGVSVGEDEGAKERMLMSIKELEKKANEIKPIGRISINLYLDLERFENSPYNITLKDGDELYIPEMTDTVTVIGQVLNQNTFIYDPKLDAEDYIQKAGGLNQTADDEHIYIVKANGEAYRYQRSYFKANQEIFKGDTIVVPMKLDAISNLKFTKDVSDILYKLAVTAASLKTVGAL